MRAIIKAVIKSATAVKSTKEKSIRVFYFFYFSVYVWSVVLSEGLEVKSRNGKLQRRRPVPQWMSGQDKDMAGMGDNCQLI